MSTAELTPPHASSTDDDDDEPPIRLASAVSDRFQPAPDPPSAPDGGPIIPPQVAVSIPPEEESLCAVGPCRHYHRIKMPFEAATPLDGSATYRDGTPIKRPMQIVRQCYPAAGRAFDLADSCVLECNRHDPVGAEEPGRVVRSGAARAANVERREQHQRELAIEQARRDAEEACAYLDKVRADRAELERKADAALERYNVELEKRAADANAKLRRYEELRDAAPTTNPPPKGTP